MDHAAATPMDGCVVAAMLPFLTDDFYNPSATYAPACAVSEELQIARTRVAHWLGTRPSEVTFTAGGTEANNLAIHGIMQRYPQANVVVSTIEHEAVLRPAGKYDCRLAPVDENGVVQLDALEASVDDKTVLVSIMYANNEIGTVQPIREISRLLEGIRVERRKSGNDTPLYLHSDACQAAAYLDLHTARLGVDLMTINGGKMYGPKQTGVLYVKAGLTLAPLLQGGGQEHGLRSGTEDVAGCAGLAAALDLVQTARHGEVRRLQQLQSLFVKLLHQKVPSARINGSLKKRLPNNIHLTIPGQDNERMILELEARGVLAAAGSACSASSGEPSHVLQAIGLSNEDAQSSLRFTMGNGTTEAAVLHTVDALEASINANVYV